MNKAQTEIKAIAAQLRVTGDQASVSAAPLFGSNPDLEQLWQQLEDQIYTVNQLVDDQEAAMLQLQIQLQAIVQQLEQKHSQFSKPLPASQPDIWQNKPWQNKPWQNKTKSIAISLWPAVAAGVTAGMHLGQAIARPAVWAITRLGTALGQQARRSHHHPGQPAIDAVEIFPSLQTALSLIVGFALLRILLDRLVQLSPSLWPVTILLMAIPAAIAVYRSTVVPQSGFLWGSRLTLILIGLLLGGRM